MYQEGASEYNSPSGAPLHRADVNESHFSRTADDLHPPPYVHPLPRTSVSKTMKEKHILATRQYINVGLIFFPALDCYPGKQMWQHIASWEATNACYPSSRTLKRRPPTDTSNPPKTSVSLSYNLVKLWTNADTKGSHCIFLINEFFI